MASYDPYQYSLARAQVVGNTVSGIERALVDTASKISLIAKQKDADKKIKGVYDNAVSRFVEEITTADPSISREKALITAMRRLPAPMSGLSTEDNLKNLLSASTAADKYLEDVRTKATTRTESEQMSKGAQTAVAGRQTPVTGFTEDAGPVMNQELPATTQEQALGRVGEMSAAKEVPQRTADQWRQQPGIAALPKEPPEAKSDPLFELKKKNLELKNETEKARALAQRASANKLNRDAEETNDQAIETTTDWIYENDRSIRDDNKLVAALDKAIKKLNEGKPLDVDETSELSNAGWSGANDINTLKRALDFTEGAIASKQEDIAGLKKTRKNLIKKGKGKLAVAMGTAETEQQDENKAKAYGYIKNNATPTLYPSVDAFINSIPKEFRAVITEEVEDAKGLGWSDDQILRALKTQAQEAR